MRVAVVGVSVSPTCGVRDHAELLAAALQDEGVECSMHWLTRSSTTLRGSRTEMGAWTQGLAAELQRSQAQAIVLHYSVFSYSHKGLPIFVPAVISALRRSRLPIVTIAHELAFPLRKAGVRGNTWAVTQRLVLIDVVRASKAVVLTADFRVQWLSTRRWLPSRPVALAPVFSNLPAGVPATPTDGSAHVLGLFGYRYDDGAVARVLGALGLLRARGFDVRLRLLGGPGPGSASGMQWASAATSLGLGSELSFSGTLPAQELANELAACDVLLFADTPGPSSRKGTLAGSLASGRPLVATEGHREWGELTQAGAARVVAPSAEAIADGVAGLLVDESERDALGASGGEFAEREMSVQRTVEVVKSLLAAAIA